MGRIPCWFARFGFPCSSLSETTRSCEKPIAGLTSTVPWLLRFGWTKKATLWHSNSSSTLRSMSTQYVDWGTNRGAISESAKVNSDPVVTGNKPTTWQSSPCLAPAWTISMPVRQNYHKTCGPMFGRHSSNCLPQTVKRRLTNEPCGKETREFPPILEIL